MFQTPILFLVFNRPDVTRQVLEQIRKIKPRFLYVAADGPRPDRPDDAKKCKEVRELVIDNIDWDCELKTLFREENLGCGVAVSEAITWFFEQEERGIILEDDCLPDATFFGFCEEMLSRYESNASVSHINGTNFQFGIKHGLADYYFSNYSICWGWATWKRAWETYHFRLKELAPIEDLIASLDCLSTKDQRRYWVDVLNIMYGDNPIDTWDYQWFFCLWYKGKIAISPNTNLISNVGFGEDATHTTQHYMDINKVRLAALDLVNITHPQNMEVINKADLQTFNVYFDVPTSKLNKLRNLSYKVIPASFFVFWRKLKSSLKTIK